MVPDFRMLLPDAPDRLQTHSFWPGLLSFSLPVGIAFYALTLLLVKPAVLEILPNGPHVRLRDPQAGESSSSLWRWIWAALAILAGAVTHLIWDGFTHERAAGVRMFPVLDEFGPPIDGHSLQLYRWLQYFSSVLGLAVVLIALGLWLWHSRSPAPPPQRRLGPVERRCWLMVYLLTPLIAVGARAWIIRGHPLLLGSSLEALAVTGMRASALTLVLASLIIRARLAAGRYHARRH